MYEKTDKLCPKCFRWLRENNETLYCPDTILCQLVTPKVGRGSPPRLTLDKLQEVLAFEDSKSRQYQDRKRIERIKEAIARLS
ncbi:hypothetical protein [Vibrio scophthalmi]|uniref:hypothetical protein n=1 Tax=Vibrio scophthalmi TaxID=45658 RepID=UPI00080C9ED7|nr:hypothetical protein [Vibrio scophthalmi]